MRPPEVLDHQAALIDHLDSAFYAKYLDSMASDMVRKKKLANHPGGKNLAEALKGSLKVAQAFHVQPEMMPLVRAAAMDLDDDDHIIRTRLPADNGFLVFAEPWNMTDVWGERTSISAINWRHGTANVAGTDKPGLTLTHFTDIYDETDEVTQSIISAQGIDTVRQLGRFQVNNFGWIQYGEPVGPTDIVTDEAYANFALQGTTLAGSTVNTNRMLVALFRLLTQVIVEVADAPIDRATTRRMTRKNLPTRVQTIKLRRKQRIIEGDTHGQGNVEWQHQWPVRGHWAWRKCGHDHPSSEPYDKGWRTRVYVAPYWKGPEDAPILLTEKVWGLAQ